MSATSPASTAPQDGHLSARPRVGAAEALRRYPLVVLIPVLLLAAAGVALALHRSQSYTATAQDVVQSLSPSVAQLPGALQAAQDLASNQSRLIGSAGITEPVARQLDTTPADVEDRLTATPVPDSTIVKIEAEGTSAGDAVALANAGAEAFADYVNGLLETDAGADAVLEDYKAASAAYQRAITAKHNIEDTDVPTSSVEYVRAVAAVDAARLRRDALSTQYQALVQSHASSPTVQQFALARGADSDRNSRLQIFVFAGIVGGLLIGIALATLLANRRRVRA